VDALRIHWKAQEEERAEAGPRWHDQGLVFCTTLGTALNPDNERKQFLEIVNRAGLGHLTPNELRHSAASLMLAQDVAIEVVSEILGHTSIRITKDVYGHIGEKQRRGATEAIAEALWESR
jgi:integrase